MKLFITDYASYNEGKQFKHGHWVDLTDFNDVEEFNEYITNHFNSIDISDPEPMYTDFEGFPDSLYSESMSQSELEKLFSYKELDFENMDDNEKVSLWNEYCQAQNYDTIEIFDEEFFEIYFSNNPMGAARAVQFGDVNWSHKYIQFNGQGNLDSYEDPTDVIDESALIDWLIERM